MSPAPAHLLDNPVWHALHGPQAHLADPGRDPLALRFAPDVSPFGAVDRLDESSWAALAKLVGPEGLSVLVRPEPALAPAGWTEVLRAPCYQMVAGSLPAAPKIDDAVDLCERDVPEMLTLVELTNPGPFAERTLAMGGYVGVRCEGRLVAMAGRRIQPPGWCEVSAVCTHPDFRGRGLGAALTLRVACGIREEGRQVFLHVLETNETAVRLYRALGFEVRRSVAVTVNRLSRLP